MEPALHGRTDRVTIREGAPFVIIGECINPSGRKRLAESLTQGDMSLVQQEASAQVVAGAQVIDVNVSAVDVDEQRILSLAVQTAR